MQTNDFDLPAKAAAQPRAASFETPFDAPVGSARTLPRGGSR
jgi:hypothetical protein